MINDDEKLDTLDEFCTKLKITRACGRRWVLERKIATYKVGRLVRIPASEARRILREGLRPAREEVRGPLADLNRITWKDRKAVILATGGSHLTGSYSRTSAFSTTEPGARTLIRLSRKGL